MDTDTTAADVAAIERVIADIETGFNTKDPELSVRTSRPTPPRSA